MLDHAPRPAAKGQRFWNKFAGRYAARTIKDVAAYTALIEITASYLRPTDRVLEIGCGTGGIAIRLAPHVAQYTATDFSTEMVRIAQAKPAPETLRFVVAEAETAFADGPYDAVCAFAVLHLVDDLQGTLRRAYACLRPGGVLISKTWCFADLGWKLRALFAVLRRVGMFPPATYLTEPQLRQAMLDAGFDIVDQRSLGARSQNPYIVARKPAEPSA